MADNFFTEIQLPQQKHYNSVPIPSVLTPTKQYSVSHLVEAIKKKKPYLESLILKSGAVLLRGFDVQNAKEFNDVIEAFGYEEFPMMGGTALRNHVYARVYSANDSPPEQQINFHHEMSQAPVSPSKIIFFCETAPKSGGETAIAWSHIIYERMKEKHPEFVEKLEKHGMIYWRVLGAEDDYSTLSGRSWKTMYGTDDKALAEERAAELGIKFEWLEDGRVKRSTNPIPTIRYDKVRQRKVWFATMVGWEVAGTDPLKAMNFGDGSPLPADICDDCLNILEEEGVFIPWQEGDILVIDNTAVLHSRRPSKPPRRVLASLCK